MAKMCVRELRTEAPNTSVFYMAAVSLVAAIVGCFLPMAWGDTTSFKVPDRWFQWLLLVGIGEHPGSPLFTISYYISFSRNREQREEEKPSKACWMHIARPLQHNDQMVPNTHAARTSQDNLLKSVLPRRGDIVWEPVLHDLRAALCEGGARAGHVLHISRAHHHLRLLHLP